MKKSYLVILLVYLIGPVVDAHAQADQIDRDRKKRAQTGMQFLSISMSPRAAAMGDAMAAVDLASSMAMFYNPATMASLDGGSASFGIVDWIADIGYSSGSIAYSPLGGRYGVFGATLMAVDYGDLEGTIRADNEQGYEVTGDFSPTALAIGVGYAKSLSDRFAIGANARYVHQDLGESVMSADMATQGNTVSTPVFDFGVLYRTGYRSLTLAMMARNFSPAVKFEEDAFETPLSLNVGASFNMADLMPAAGSMHDLLISVEAGHPRSYAEQIRIGGEYRFMNLLSLRAGYFFPSDEQGLSLGGGLNLSYSGLSLGIDYSYSTFGIFDNVNRFGVLVGF